MTPDERASELTKWVAADLRPRQRCRTVARADQTAAGRPRADPGYRRRTRWVRSRGVLPRTQAPATRAGRPGVTARRVDRAKLCTRRGLAPSRSAVCPRSPDHVGAPEDESPDRPTSTPFSPETRVLSHFFKATSHADRGGGGEAVRRFDRESPATADHAAGNAADDGRALAPTAGHLVQHPA